MGYHSNAMGADTSKTALPRACEWQDCTKPGHCSVIRVVFTDPTMAASIDTRTVMCHDHGEEFARGGLMRRFLSARLPALERHAGSKAHSLALWVGVKCLARVGLHG